MPNFFSDVLGAFVGIFTCTRKKRSRDQAEILEEENLFYQNKKRRLSGPGLILNNTPPRKDLKVDNIFSKNIFSESDNTSGFYFDNFNQRKSLQTQIIKGTKQDEIFFSKISNVKKKNLRRKIDFEEQEINKKLYQNLGNEYVYQDDIHDNQKIIELENLFLNKYKDTELYDNIEQYTQIVEPSHLNQANFLNDQNIIYEVAQNNSRQELVLIQENGPEEILEITYSPCTKPPIIENPNFHEFHQDQNIIVLGDSEVNDSSDSSRDEEDDLNLVTEEEIRNDYEYLINSLDLDNKEIRNFPDIEYEKFVKFRK
jgi:hypothetical protein